MPLGPLDRVTGLRVGLPLGGLIGGAVALLAGVTRGGWLVVLLVTGAVVGGFLGALWAGH